MPDIEGYCRQDKLIVYRAEAPPRVADQELSDLTVYLTGDTQRAELPMNDLRWFAIHSTRRVSEICRPDTLRTQHLSTVTKLPNGRRGKAVARLFD